MAHMQRKAALKRLPGSACARGWRVVGTTFVPCHQAKVQTRSNVARAAEAVQAAGPLPGSRQGAGDVAGAHRGQMQSPHSSGLARQPRGTVRTAQAKGRVTWLKPPTAMRVAGMPPAISSSTSCPR